MFFGGLMIAIAWFAGYTVGRRDRGLPFLLLLALLMATAREARAQLKPASKIRAGTWFGMQEGRGGALDAGLGAAYQPATFPLVPQVFVAQNRIGFGLGFRRFSRLSLGLIADTRDRSWKPGIQFLAVTF